MFWKKIGSRLNIGLGLHIRWNVVSMPTKLLNNHFPTYYWSMEVGRL